MPWIGFYQRELALIFIEQLWRAEEENHHTGEARRSIDVDRRSATKSDLQRRRLPRFSSKNMDEESVLYSRGEKLKRIGVD